MTLRQRWLQIVRNLLGLRKSEEKDIKYHKVIERETELLKVRREKLKLENPEKLEENKFGIALSGGGIRSATINLGFLETLNEFKILERADYISTVSGGGYTGAYVQATLKNEAGDYSKLFDQEHISHLRNNGEYMIPGKGLVKMFNRIILVVGFAISLLMSWLSPFIIGMMGYLGYLLLDRFGLDQTSYQEAVEFLFVVIIPIGMVLFFIHFISNVLLSYHLKLSNFFNKIEAFAVVVLGIVFTGIFLFNLNWSNMNIRFGEVSYYLMILFALFILGYFANPNALSFHRFYRNQLANAFLAKTKNPNILLQNLIEKGKDEKGKGDYMHAPYPLINTCLNLLTPPRVKREKFEDAKEDYLEDGKVQQNISFVGAKANDYFLLSPLFCGSKLAGYVPTNDTYNYRDLTLPAAATISAAAVNPGMGIYSNKILSILTTIFNARLGYWILNPKKTKLYNSLIWWPRYFVYELLGLIGIENEMLNISDGGHIENLAIYELLRRRCKLILAVDAGADPKFTFSEFENLTIRAKNELGLDIRFSKNQLEDEIRPKPSLGYSKKRFAVADICYLWEEIVLRDKDDKIILIKVKEDGEEKEKPIEVLINYRKYDKNPDREEAVQDILTLVEKLIGDRISDPILKKEALENVKKIVSKNLENDLKIGTLVYIKSSVTPPPGKPNIDKKRDPLRYYTYKYKIYNPEFPHESTADQFFDPVQWTAYYDLGRFICSDVLGIDNLDSYLSKMKGPQRPSFGIDDLINRRFGRRVKIFEEHKQIVEEEKERIEKLNQEQKDEMLKQKPAPMTMRELEPIIGTVEEAAQSVPINESEAEMISPTSQQAPKKDAKIVVGEDINYKM
ncbi:MAG: patatin-like phospholipase family protein [Saprospiraceae bacterium]